MSGKRQATNFPVALPLAGAIFGTGIPSSNDLSTPGVTSTTEPEQVTDLLLRLRHRDPAAMDRLFPLVYDELRRIAHRKLQGERPGHTLGTTGLVHETYLKLVDQTRVQWRDRGHFFRVASWAMRRILVDYARSYRALRRGGGLHRVPLDEDARDRPSGERRWSRWTRRWTGSPRWTSG